MQRFYNVGSTVLILISLLMISSCGPSNKRVSGLAITADLSGLRIDRSQAPSQVFIRPGAPTLAAYNRFIIGPVEVDYFDPQMKELKQEDVERMQKYFRNVMIKEIRNGGYQVGTRSQADTMRISLTLSGLKAPSAAANVTAVLAPFVISVGEVTVQAVFREALTRRIDAVVVATTQGSRVLDPSPWSTWTDVENAFDDWAEGVREAIDKAHNR
jgi:voltage-gated potassium channel Kch